MSVQRFAGGIDIMEQQNQLMQQINADSAKRRAENEQRMAQQTRRDVAAAYGQVIPFD